MESSILYIIVASYEIFKGKSLESARFQVLAAQKAVDYITCAASEKQLAEEKKNLCYFESHDQKLEEAIDTTS